MPTIEAGLRQTTWRQIFYIAIAISCAVTVFVGFAPTFYLKRVFDAPPLPTLVVVHGSVFTCWVLLLVTQASLVRAGRTDLHRRLGVAGLGLASLMVILGVLTAIEGARRGITAAGMDPNMFLAIPLASILLFAVYMWLAAINRFRPDYHKRFVLLATFSILTPAIARWPAVHQRPPIALALTLLFLLAAAGYDLRTRRRIHPVYIWGGLALLVSGPLRVAVAHSHLWRSIASELVQ